MSQPFFDEAVAERAQNDLTGRVIKAVGTAQAAGNFSSTRNLVGLVPMDRRRDEAVLGLLGVLALHELAGCIEDVDSSCFNRAYGEGEAAGLAEAQLLEVRHQADKAAHTNMDPLWSTIRSNKALEDRKAACAEIERYLVFIEDATSPKFTPKAQEIRERCAKIREQLEARIKAEQERKRKAEEAARFAEQRAREAAARRWAMAPLRCGDGTLSPTCVCGGSRKGCCSHHGGVAGCSQ